LRSRAQLVAAAREQAHVVAVPPDLETVAFVLDLVRPAGPRRRLRGAGGDTGRKETGGHGVDLAVAPAAGQWSATTCIGKMSIGRGLSGGGRRATRGR
jgi:hypothetical protein